MPRTDGYAPIGDYAAIGDGRAFALVARDGAIDWLALPRLDSPPVFFALLDARRGGRLQLAPEDDFETARAYDEGTNVLMTTFHTKGGSVRVADAIALYELGLPPWIELVRRVEGLSGSVAMRWRFVPRFGWGECETTIELRRGSYVAGWKDVVLALHVWDAGEPEHRRVEIVGRFEAQEGASSLLALTSARAEPIPFPPRKDVERRLEATRNRWRTWSETTAPEGPHRKAAERSALALKLLTHAPTGAIAAAATTSLPEQIGGDRSYDYRYGWVRDVAFLGRRADQPRPPRAGARIVHVAAARRRRRASPPEPVLPARRHDAVRPAAEARSRRLSRLATRARRQLRREAAPARVLRRPARDGRALRPRGKRVRRRHREADRRGDRASAHGVARSRTRAPGSSTTSSTTPPPSSRPGWPSIARFDW